jgi:hypothetical protein
VTCLKLKHHTYTSGFDPLYIRNRKKRKKKRGDTNKENCSRISEQKLLT